MPLSTLSWSVAAIALTAAAVPAFGERVTTGQEEHSPCTEDAMIVFDASGSMSGNGWGYGSETAGTVSRIDKVRSTLAKMLPKVTRSRRVGLITYGPVAEVGDWREFRSGRNLAAWIGLVPKQHSTGGKDRLGSITKQGNRYLRWLLVAGAMAVIRYAQKHGTEAAVARAVDGAPTRKGRRGCSCQ